jgi:FkbM family methyltransferase
MPKTEERVGLFELKDAVAWNQAEIAGDGPVVITTPADQWAFAALFPIRDTPECPLAETGPLLIRLELLVEEGEIGVAVAEPSLQNFITPEKRALAGVGTVLEIPLSAPLPGCHLVVRNVRSGGTPSRVQIESIKTFVAPLPTGMNPPGFVFLETLASTHLPEFEAIPSELELSPAGVEVFDTPEALAINRARLDHLATLGLPIDNRSVLDVGCGVGHLSQFFVDRGCRVLCVDARGENLSRLAELYPGRKTARIHVERDPMESLGLFDIVFCYGLIYHCENPIAALRNITSCCRDLLLLETVITDHPRPIMQLVDEAVANHNQAASGFGSRPSPAFIAMALSRMGFPFVYAPRTSPNHPDFRVQWQNDCAWRRDDHLLRSVIVASRSPLENPNLNLVLNAQALGASKSDFQPVTSSSVKVWLDVGAHRGERTFSAAVRDPNLRVYAFEPHLPSASQLMGRLANYVVLPVAVAEVNGSAPFYVNRFDGASSLLPFVSKGLAAWEGGSLLQVESTTTVPTIRLDTFLNQCGIAKVDFLKIDAQGADLAVVRSLGSRLQDVKRICLEVQVTSVPLYSGAASKQQVIDFLDKAGFELTATEKQSCDQEENLTFIHRRF